MPPRRSSATLTLVPGFNRQEASDETVGRGLQAGEAWALSEAWRRFAPMVVSLGARMLGADAEGDDLAQEVFCRLFQKAKTLRDPSTLRSFVFSFAVRVLKTELRRRRARRWLTFSRPSELPEVVSEPTDMESQDLLRRFYAILDRLDARDRLIFGLRHLERLTVEEIAAAMTLSASTVKRSLARTTGKVSLWVSRDLGMEVSAW